MLLAREIADEQLAVIRRNARFNRLSPEKKRVVVAKDVLKRLGEGRIEARRGVYIGRVSTGPAGETCQACALGAVFACAINLGTKATTSIHCCRTTSSYDMTVTLAERGIFPAPELRKIEAAFEGWGAADSFEGTEATRRFNEGIFDDRERMARIMRNIVANKGEFVP
jgi:hypothetical protein